MLRDNSPVDHRGAGWTNALGIGDTFSSEQHATYAASAGPPRRPLTIAKSLLLLTLESICHVTTPPHCRIGVHGHGPCAKGIEAKRFLQSPSRKRIEDFLRASAREKSGTQRFCHVTTVCVRRPTPSPPWIRTGFRMKCAQDETPSLCQRYRYGYQRRSDYFPFFR